MIQQLPYQFQRKSKNHFDWLLNVIKSEKYYQADSIILNPTKNNYLKSEELKSA